MYAFEYKKVSSIAEAAQHLNSDTRLLAGGQTLLAAMKLRLSSPSELIDLQNIPNLLNNKLIPYINFLEADEAEIPSS